MEPIEFTLDPIEVTQSVHSDLELPLILQPSEQHRSAPTHDVCDWITQNKASLNQALLQHGAILFRGFDGIDNVERFEEVVDTISPDLLPYVRGTTNRSNLTSRIATASDPTDKGEIPLHQEMAYQESYPSHVMFYCIAPPSSGGQTPLGSVRLFRDLLDSKIWAAFAARGVRTRRLLRPFSKEAAHYGGKPWNLVLLTEDRDEAERIMHSRGYEFQWLEDGSVEILQPALPAIRKHPATGEELWFNQAHIHHHTIGSYMLWRRRKYLFWGIWPLLRRTRKHILPYQTSYGDGGSIPVRYLKRIRACLDKVTTTFSWQKHDFVLLDNHLVFHGRAAYAGERLIAAALLTRTLAEATHESSI